ncbi:MAG: hypothetical protein U0132_22020 [Gemmatimonadaceae bacterium]
MMAPLLPRSLGAEYRGSQSALWLFGLVVTVRSLQSLVSIFNGHYVAITADGIPVDSYTAAGAQTVLALFALIGVAKLPFHALSVLALVRFRSAVPLFFAIMALEYIVRSLTLMYLPIERSGPAGGLVVNRVLFAVMLVGLWLSLRTRRDLT